VKRIFLYISLLLSPALFLSCQKNEGCTNKKAINYDITADVDDGSCIICEETKEEIGTMSNILIVDGNINSPYFDVEILDLSLFQYDYTYNNSLCGTESCGIDMLVKNLIGDNIDNISLRLNVFLTNGTRITAFLFDTDVEAGGEVLVRDVVNSANDPNLCTSVNSATYSYEFFSASYN